QFRYDFVGKNAQRLPRSSRIDQEHVLDATGPQPLEPLDNFGHRTNQRRVGIGAIRIRGRCRWTFAGSSQATDPLEDFTPHREGALTLLVAGDNLERARYCDPVRIEQVTEALAFLTIDLHSFSDEFGRGDLVEQQIVSLPSGAPN